MNKLYFLFGIHNHQPVGNFPEVFEKAYNDAYLPFLQAMNRHPKCKWSLHCSGVLWDFIVEKHPEYCDIVTEMAARGQVELLTGGYYEPIITSIPDADKKGQIEKLTSFLRSRFNVEAKGMWLAERIWEPHIAKILSESGVKYTIVDDAHFAAAGRDVEKLRGYYITEEQGTALSIFPISQRLRYAIPFEPVERTIEYMASWAKETPNAAMVMADDGEKFGLWPETFKHVYNDGWLDRFLDTIERNGEWIETMTFSEYRDRFPALGRVYIPAASYFEMSEWSLPSAAQEDFEAIVKEFSGRPDVKRFLRGGFWRNFLTKYAESNNMHKKMLYVSDKLARALNKATPKAKKAVQRAAAVKLQKATDALYAGQCNCAYWHGVFGGLYLPHLRTAVYHELIKAESALGAHSSAWNSFDFDKDGNDEFIYESDKQNLYVSPSGGGSIFEWDIVPLKLNILNVLTRRPEAYHKRLREFLSNPGNNNSGIKTIHDIVKVKEDNLDKSLHFDWYRRASLLDHFLHPDTTFDNFRTNQYGEQGDFILGSYVAETGNEGLTLRRQGSIWNGNAATRIEVSKTIMPYDGGIKVRYSIKNPGEHPATFLFAPEFNFAFSCPAGDDNGAFSAVTEWVRKDNHAGLELRMKFHSPADLWVHPLETVSLSEGGFEKTCQGTVLLALYRLTLAAGASETIAIDAATKIL